MQSPRHRHDVVVVGARAAGAATALLLARRGHDVVLVERDFLPSDTLSTHQVARPGVVQLRRWGLLDAVLSSGAPAIRQITFSAAGGSVTRAVKHSAGVDLLVAPRRYVLDTLVAQAAAGAGADLRLGVTVDGVRFDDAGRAVGVYGHDHEGAPVDLLARFVIGADGLGSRVARAVGAEVIEDRGAPGATQYAYYTGPSWHGIELIVSERALTGVFPTHHGQACIWICGPTADAHDARHKAASREDAFTAYLHRSAPELAARLRTGRRLSPVTGMLRAPNHLRQAHGPGWALVGDAGYHRDPVTGHGLSDAYRDAELLATALNQALSGDLDPDTALAGYQHHRDRALRRVFDLTVALAGYPPAAEFIRLQKQLARALDTEASQLAARPAPSLNDEHQLATA
jgi:2-polyprenyl-6-methoxyphenol hydroxylase-like FAD-dependent oxidoreductase